MPAADPPVANAKPGTIAIAAVSNAAKPGGQEATPKTAPAKLKTIVRRLPPGLSREEFETAIGQEWLPGKGKVDWLMFKPGKIAKDSAKPSRPARCYLHLTAQTHLAPLAQHVQSSQFVDAKNTISDPALIGPPILDYAMFQRVPTGKKRNDARQGLIDQEPEFIEFLESLTNPITKPPNVDAVLKEEATEAITITPLIQHLKEKKAAKEKAKETKYKKHDRQASKAETTDAKDAPAKSLLGAKDDKKNPRRTVRLDKKPEKDVPTKEKGASPQKEKAKPASQSARSEKPAADAAAPSTPGRASAHKDTRGGGTQRRGAGRHSTARGDAPAGDAARQTSTAAPVTPSILKRQAPASTPSTINASTAKVATLANPNGTQAFLKHANSSQGITEALIQSALSAFGPVKSVEIEKRKGFAHVEFQDSASLAKAVGQGTLKIAQGNVLILERKERKENDAKKSEAKASDTNNWARPSTPAASTASGPASTPTNKSNTTLGKSDQSGRGNNRSRGGRGGRGGGAGRGGRGGSNTTKDTGNASGLTSAAVPAPPKEAS